MDRTTLKEEEKKRKVNRMISYIIVVVSIILLVFCIYQVAEYISLVNRRSTLTKNLEILKQDSNYLRDAFDVLKDDDYYSVYIDSNFQFVDSKEDFVSVIR